MQISIFCIITPLILNAIEFPLEFNGRGFLGKYLNSDTTRYNMDASIQLRSTIARLNNFSFYMEYRDDLDMAEQKGGVSLDPRYAHYYFTGGFEFWFLKFFSHLAFIHDCVHDIDYEVEGTPVFNRISLLFANADYHPSIAIGTEKKLLWALNMKLYPHWRYHGWDVNAGADYQYEAGFDLAYKIISSEHFGAIGNINFTICKGDTTYYHQDFLKTMVFYTNMRQRIGAELKYNVYNNDPIKNPGGLWLLSAFVEF
ncbi:MAG: hypothetical protein ABIL22_03990 [candidate division WOR-3 bacterium]